MSVVDTIRSAQVAVGRRPATAVLVWVTHYAVTESAVAEQKRHLETVIDLVRRSVTKRPVIVWGPASSTLPPAPAEDSDVVIVHGGASEESLVATLLQPAVWSVTSG